jgi:hypothetical protein
MIVAHLLSKLFVIFESLDLLLDYSFLLGQLWLR